MGVNAFGFHFLRERKNINQQEKAIAISLMRLGFTNTYVKCTVSLTHMLNARLCLAFACFKMSKLHLHILLGGGCQSSPLGVEKKATTVPTYFSVPRHLIRNYLATKNNNTQKVPV
jgi:hypothetical protein